MLRCGDQVRLTTREVELLSERLQFVPEAIRSEADLRDWFERVRRYYTAKYGAGSDRDRMARRQLDREFSRLLEAD